MSVAFIFTSLFVIFLVTAYLYVKNVYSYWKRKGVPFKKPSLPFGNFTNTFLQKKSFSEDLADAYNGTTEPFIGLFMSIQPTLLVRDPAIIKDMFIKQFQSFSHRGFNASPDVDPMADNILLQKGDKWKNARTQFSPAFTSGKLKGMFGTIVDCGQSLDKYISKLADTGKTVEMREVFARFATNVIVSTAFGIDIDCIENPENEFRKHGQALFEPSIKNALRANLSVMTPKLARLLRIRFADKESGDFMIDAVKQNIDYREQNDVTRKDFFQLLMQLRNTGKVQDDDDWSAKSTSDKKAISIEEMAAQAFLFFAGGFESSSSTMSFCIYELAKHPEIQQKAYEEIVAMIEKHDGKLTYEAVADMKFMSQCIDESLRLHPPFGVATRKSTMNYRIPNTDVIIEEGTTILFSAVGLQYDPKYYDEPTKFKPERYAESEKAKKSFTDMPNLVFGDGPRNCLGMRLGLLQSKIALILSLRKFRFELGYQHKNTELKLNPTSVVVAPLGGLNLKVIRR